MPNRFCSWPTMMSVITLRRIGDDFPSDAGIPRALRADALILAV